MNDLRSLEVAAQFEAAESIPPCSLCRLDESQPWNRSVLTGNGFRVIPSLGSLLDRWLLVVPEAHVLSLSDLDPAEGILLRGVVEEIVQRFVDSQHVVWFEHGATTSGHPVGCGVDHAHLHVVETQVDLLAGVKRLLPDLHWDRGPELASIGL